MIVRAYWNLHKKCWSLKAKGQPIHHATEVTVEDARFIVQPAGRERVRREKRKNVHAFVEGQTGVTVIPRPTVFYPSLVTQAITRWGAPQRIHYDPYLDAVDTFFTFQGIVMGGMQRRVPVESAALVFLTHGGSAWAWDVKERS